MRCLSDTLSGSCIISTWLEWHLKLKSAILNSLFKACISS